MTFKQLCENTGKFKVETRTAENTVSLEWNKVTYADGYRVFSSVHGKNCFIGMLNTKNTKVVISNCKNGVPVDYKVKAFRIADGPDNFFGESVVVTVCPMETPSNLTVTVDKDGNPVLNWFATSDCDGYKVYCDTQGNDKFSFLCYSGKQTCVLRDFKSTGNVRFKIRSFRIFNNIEKISNSSNIAEIVLKSKMDTKESNITVKRPEKSVTVKKARFENKQGKLLNNNNKCMIMLGGDITTCSSVQNDAISDGYSFDFTLSSVGDVMASSDFSIASLDTDLNDSKEYTCENRSYLNCPSVLAESLSDCGLDAVALNTWLLKKTPDALRNYPLSVIGQNGGEIGRDKFTSVNINNISVAFFSTVIGTDMAAAISSAKRSGSEYIVVYCSWKERHTPFVKDTWKKYAARLAAAGADFIVGCGVNTLCEYDIITTSDGREVPVAYSLGCLVANEAVTSYEQLGALICLRLARDAATGKVSREFTGYIPFSIRSSSSMKRAVILSEQNRVYFGSSEFESDISAIAGILGDKINAARSKINNRTYSFALHGSSLISGLFSKNDNVITDRTHLFISQLAMSGDFISNDERYYRDSVAPLYWNLSKGFAEYVSDNRCDYLILDLYYAACAKLFEYNGVVYSGGKAFVESVFFNEHKSEMKTVDINKNQLWKTYLDRYISDITRVYDGKHIMLVRVREPNLYYLNGRFVKESDFALNEKRLQLMENYFIEKVNPVVIDFSSYYCGVVKNRGGYFAINRDHRFSENISAAALSTASDKKISYNFTHGCDAGLWLDMIGEYFDSIKNCDCGSFFFNYSNAADYIISRTSREFISSNFNDLKNLKESGMTTFREILENFDFGGNYVLKRVCQAIYSIKKGDFTDECVDDVVRFELNAVNDLASSLSRYFDNTGIIPECRINTSDIEFYLKCARLCKNGTNKSAAVMLVSEYYKKNRPSTIDLWGGANLEYIMEYSKNALIGKSLSDCSVFTAFEKAVDIDLSYAENGTAVFREMSRKYAYKTAEKSDWIMVDFNEIIKPLYRHGDTVYTAVSGMEESKLFKNFCADDEMIIPYSKENGFDEKHIRNAVESFADHLIKQYGSNIILSRFELNSNYLDINRRIRPFSDEAIDSKNKLIAFAESVFIKKTECYVISFSDKFIGEQGGVRGQAFTAAYEEMFYTSSAAAVDSIVTGGSEKLVDKVDLLRYIERAEQITAANPDMPYELKKQVFSDAALLV